MVVQIVRYANRKLYSRVHSHYVNLSDIVDMIKQGSDVQVTCNKTGADLTSDTLGQALVSAGNVPVFILKDLIKGLEIGTTAQLSALDVIQLDTSDFQY